MSKKIYLPLAICALVGAALLTARSQRLSRIVARPAHTTANGAHVSSLARALRPNYPYSVIPGGAYTPAELRAALSRDPLLRQHFSNFDLSKLRLLKLTEDHYAFVSFRRNGRILWTRRKLKIPQGEILLTDGVYYAKTRCGNRLAEQPAASEETAELADSVLSPPPLDYPLLAGLQFVQAPVEEAAQAAPRDALTPAGPLTATPLETALSSPTPLSSNDLPGVLPASGPAGGAPGAFPQDLLAAGSPGLGDDWGGGVASAAGKRPSLLRADLVTPIALIPEPSAMFVCAALLCCFLVCRIRREPHSEL